MAQQNRRPCFRRQDSIADFASSLGKDVSMQSLSEMKDLFRSCDKDGDGELTVEELGTVMTELGIKHKKQELQAMFSQLDVDNNGAITFDEFIRGLNFMAKSKRLGDRIGLNRQNSVATFIQSLEDSQVTQMRELFSLIDTNNDGYVTKMELYNVMKQMGLEPTKEDVIELFSELDTDGNGRIEFKEFAAGMRWLKKGGLINTHVTKSEAKPEPEPEEPRTPREDRLRIANLQERNAILESCLKDTIARGMTLAERHYKAKEYKEAALVLSALNIGTLIDMETFLGPLTTPKQKEHFAKMSRRLASYTNPVK